MKREVAIALLQKIGKIVTLSFMIRHYWPILCDAMGRPDWVDAKTYSRHAVTTFYNKVIRGS